MVQLVYASAALAPFSEEALKLLLLKARIRNAFHQVTGVLLYQSDAFLQVLEGEEDNVDLIFNLIQRDSRHTKLKVLMKQRTEKREFPDWSMGFIDMSTWDAHTPGLADYYRTLPKLISGPTPAKQYIRIFHEGRCRLMAA